MNSDLYRKTLAGWEAKVGDGLAGLARAAIQDMCEDVIDNTRVDTGFLVANWQPSLGAPVLAEDVTGLGNGYAQSKMGMVVADIEIGDTFFFTNNASYARRREYGFVGPDSLGRVYNEPGDHMVANAIGKWDIIVEGAAKRLGLVQ